MADTYAPLVTYFSCVEGRFMPFSRWVVKFSHKIGFTMVLYLLVHSRLSVRSCKSRCLMAYLYYPSFTYIRCSEGCLIGLVPWVVKFFHKVGFPAVLAVKDHSRPSVAFCKQSCLMADQVSSFGTCIGCAEGCFWLLCFGLQSSVAKMVPWRCTATAIFQGFRC